MKHVNTIVHQQSILTQGAGTLSPFDAELINYVFEKIRLTWGQVKYEHLATDNKNLSEIKQEWAKDILKAVNARRVAGRESDDEYLFRVKSRIDNIFSNIRTIVDTGKQKQWEWPSLRTLVAFIANYKTQASHRPYIPQERRLPDLGAREINLKAGCSILDELRGELKGSDSKYAIKKMGINGLSEQDFNEMRRAEAEIAGRCKA